jgi:2-oxoglutarate ferredoxin oxidoreductase subunit beta
MTPLEANRRIETEMIPYFPLGVYKERKGADFT